MRRTHLVAVLLICISACESPIAQTKSSNSNQPIAKRPNIILIYTDDQDTVLARMPRLRNLLVSQGTSFRNSFTPTALCCPSRVSLLRGQYTHNHGVITNNGPDGGFPKVKANNLEASTIALWMQEAGYRTALVGGYVKDYYPRTIADVPAGWDVTMMGTGFEMGALLENGKWERYDASSPKSYSTDLFGEKALDLIRDWSDEDKPFFIKIALSAPHNPFTPAPRHVGAFASLKAPRTGAFNEADVSDKPALIRNRALSDADLALIDRFYRQQQESLLAVDELVENIVNGLAAAGALDNTYIFYTSDNGFMLGTHRIIADKDLHYEEAIRVPLIVRGPGVPKGVVRDEFVLNIDLPVTFAALAGATVPSFVDGRSLAPLLTVHAGDDEEPRQAILVEHWPWRGRPGMPNIQVDGVRTRDYLYAEWSTGERELYDLRNDPGEMNNLLGADGTKPHHAVPMLARSLESLRHCAGASCREAENQSPR